MKIKDLERYLARMTPWNLSVLDQHTRRLRELRMLPQGGRGPHAPEISWEHAATLLISLAAADKAVDAAHSVMTYAPLKPQKDGDPYGFAGCETFGEAMTRILESDICASIKEVAVNKTWPQATITHNDGRAWVYGFAGVQDVPADFKTFLVRVETRIKGGFLHQLKLNMEVNAGRVATRMPPL